MKVSVPPGAFTLKGLLYTGLGSGSSVLHPGMHGATGTHIHPLLYPQSTKESGPKLCLPHVYCRHQSLASWAILPVSSKAWEVAPPMGNMASLPDIYAPTVPTSPRSCFLYVPMLLIHSHQKNSI